HRGYEFDEAFGNQDHPVIFAGLGAGRDDSRDVFDDLIEAQIELFHLFGNQGDVGARLQAGLQGDMTGGSAHELDEMPVFLGRSGVPGDIADQLGIGLDGRIESEGNGNMGILEIAVDGLGHADDGGGKAFGLEVLRQDGRVGVGVVPAYDHDRVEFQALDHLDAPIELVRSLELGASRTDDVEAAGIPVLIHLFGGDGFVFPLFQSAGAAQKSEDLALRMNGFDAVEKARDYVMAAGSLAPGKDYADAQWPGSPGVGRAGGFTALEGKQRGAVGVRETFTDDIPILGGLGRFAFNHFDLR